jgi:hypothetical protein
MNAHSVQIKDLDLAFGAVKVLNNLNIDIDFDFYRDFYRRNS